MFYNKCFCMLRLAVVLMIVGVTLSQAAEPERIDTWSDRAGKPIEVQVLVGESWMNTFTFRSNNVTAPPQIVIWAEDINGNYLDTLYVTMKFATQRWYGTPEQKATETYRRETVPYWMHRLLPAGISSPTRKDPFPDSVTRATPYADFVLSSSIETNLSEIVLFMEVNVAFDGNQSFPTNAPMGAEGYNATSGQPALVYRARVNLDKKGETEMNLAGYSSPSGEDGSLTEDVQPLTTALKMIRRATVSTR